MEINPDLLKKYANNTCTIAEKQLVEQWLYQQDAGASFDFMEQTNPSEEERKLLYAIDNHLKKKRRLYWKPASVAAAILLTTFLGYYSYQAGFITFLSKKQVDFISVFAPKGKKKTLLLPDGSKVYLNAGSTLRYVKSFNDKRFLILEGEAFFEVAKQPNKPFIVQTKYSQIDVLGTRFNLKSFREENKTYVTVEEGRVRFSPDKHIQPIILTANKQATYQADNQHLDTLTTHSQIGWKTGYLVFDGDPLIEIVPILERWYNIRITISDRKLYSYRIRGRYQSPPLQSLLEDLAFTTDIHFRTNGNQITLYK